MNNIKVRTKLVIVMVIALIALALCAVISNTSLSGLGNNALDIIENDMRSSYDEQIKAQVDNVISLCQSIYNRYEKGEYTLDEAEKLAADQIRDLRYGNNGYFWVDTYDGTNVVLLGNDTEGTNRMDAVDTNGFAYMQAIISAGRQENGGFTDYVFPREGETEPSPKRAYSKAFEPFGWVLGTGNYTDDIDEDVLGVKNEFSSYESNSRMAIIGIAVVMEVILILVLTLITASIVKPLKKSLTHIDEIAQGDFSKEFEQDLLKRKDDIEYSRAKEVDLSRILDNPYEGVKLAGYNAKEVYDFKLDETVDESILLKKLKSALNNGQKKSIQLDVSNVNRTLGTIFGSEITRKYPDGLPEDTFTISCNGSGGQSFGAFIPKGLTLELTGDSNDYFGKGLSGGKLIVYPPQGVQFKAEDNIIIGNVALYGATSGKAFINGIAGERFCVRNSGATAVVEGTGDHGCEYMTGGCVVVLGPTGKNFAAGMSGGIAYVLDEDRSFYKRLNKELVSFEDVSNKYDVLELKGLIQEHVAYTNSEKGKRILDHFSEYLPKFKKIVPHDYRRMMNAIVQMEEKGLNSEQAQIEAFYANIRG